MASNLTDLAGTCQFGLSLPTTNQLSGGGVFALSGAAVGNVVDMLHANSYTNVVVTLGPTTSGGPVTLQVQTSDTATSGTFSDPTSGHPTGAYPMGLSSGGLFILTSGLVGGSGLVTGFAFQRDGRYARVNLLSGLAAGEVSATLVAQRKLTTSGLGVSYSPVSQTVSINV